jgi:hypothetical protein
VVLRSVSVTATRMLFCSAGFGSLVVGSGLVATGLGIGLGSWAAVTKSMEPEPCGYQHGNGRDADQHDAGGRQITFGRAEFFANVEIGGRLGGSGWRRGLRGRGIRRGGIRDRRGLSAVGE